MPESAVKVDRTTPWGNPFIVGKHGDQARCVELHRYLLAGYLCVSADNVDAQRAHREHVERHIQKLRGRPLACWCRQGKPCHADTLLEIANARTGKMKS